MYPRDSGQPMCPSGSFHSKATTANGHFNYVGVSAHRMKHSTAENVEMRHGIELMVGIKWTS
jgi:hypothetical protein